MAVDQECTLSKRNQGSLSRLARDREWARWLSFAQDPGPIGDVIKFDHDARRRRLAQHRQQRVDDRDLSEKLGIVIASQARDRTTCDVVDVPGKQVRKQRRVDIRYVGPPTLELDRRNRPVNRLSNKRFMDPGSDRLWHESQDTYRRMSKWHALGRRVAATAQRGI